LNFVKSEYDVDFPMFSKIEVNGPGACDLYAFLKAGHPTPDGAEDVAWNFTKFLVGPDGQVLARFEPTVTPEEIGEQLANYL
jgi:glutathione peroxidase